MTTIDEMAQPDKKAPIAPRSIASKLAVTFLLCLCFGLYAGQPYQGIVLVGVVIGLPVWAIWQLFRLDTATDFLVLIAQIGLWVAMAIIVTRIDEGRDARMRLLANHYVAIVQSYRHAHGRWPKDREEIGLPAYKYHELWYYFLPTNDTPPGLGYRSNLNGFDVWFFDFTKNKWVFLPD